MGNIGRPRVSRIGQKHGKLTITKQLVPSIGTGKEFNYGGTWLCQCECGNTREIKGYHLASTMSCGCAKIEGNKQAGRTRRELKENGRLVTVNLQYRSHLRRAKVLGSAPMPREIWDTMVFKPCFYCGEMDTRNAAAMYSVTKHFRVPLTPEQAAGYIVKMNGLDRIDSLQGYSVTNCVPCCTECNRMKRNIPFKEFIKRVRRVCKHVSYLPSYE